MHAKSPHLFEAIIIAYFQVPGGKGIVKAAQFIIVTQICEFKSSKSICIRKYCMIDFAVISVVAKPAWRFSPAIQILSYYDYSLL